MYGVRVRSMLKELVVMYSLFYLVTLVSGCDTPFSIVVSRSMEPAIYRGDVVLLYQTEAPYTKGEIVAFDVPGNPKTILHRVIDVSRDDRGHETILTKGDANKFDDRALYSKGMQRLERHHIRGRVALTIPWVMRPFVWILENATFKYTLLAAVVLWDLFKRTA